MSLFKISCVTSSSLGPVSHPEKGTILRRSCLVISFTLFYTVLQCFTLCPGNILATTHYWKVLVSSAPPYIRFVVVDEWIQITWFLYPLLNSVTQYIALLELWHSDSKSHASSASCRHLSSQWGAWDIVCSELQYVKRLPAICQGSYIRTNVFVCEISKTRIETFKNN